ncbi:MAG TPA: CcmD family protein [Gemmatimonadaceae bacterium]|nr:CcmD family protein [Gemmatimonadaceae bacterium]
MIESNQTFIVAAFAVTWVALLGYVLHLARRGARAVAEHERMLHESTGER